MRAYLLKRVEHKWKLDIELSKRRATSIGRVPENDVVLRDHHCSRFHCEIQFHSGQWMLKDLSSHNGTRVGGALVKNGSRVLLDGESIEIGNQVWTFAHISETSESSESPSSTDTGTVTEYVSMLNSQNSDHVEKAEYKLFQRYFDQLRRIAANKLRDTAKKSMDEEDAALSAMDSFFQHAKAGDYPDLNDRDALLALLAKITVRKAIRQIEWKTAQKRDVTRNVPITDNLDALMIDDREFELQIDEIVSRLAPEEGLIAQKLMDGYSCREIASQLPNHSTHSVKRRRDTIRKKFQNYFHVD